LCNKIPIVKARTDVEKYKFAYNRTLYNLSDFGMKYVDVLVCEFNIIYNQLTKRKKMKIFKFVLVIVFLASALTVTAGQGCGKKHAKAIQNETKCCEMVICSSEKKCPEVKCEKIEDCKKKKNCGYVKLCVKCGEIKKTEKCCKADAVKCGSCNLVKGSPGCCKIKKGAVCAGYNPETKNVESLVPGEKCKNKCQEKCKAECKKECKAECKNKCETKC